jgi:pre-60S factor REI1
LKRRVAGIPALSEEQYDAQAKAQEHSHQGLNSNEHANRQKPSCDDDVDPSPAPGDKSEIGVKVSGKVPATQCLFCNLDAPTLDANVYHMSSLHSLFIPSQERLSDIESFLGYLATIIFEWKECLYCSLKKGSVDGVQTHMRDKGHCMIRLSAESELLDFWELSDSENESLTEDGKCPKNATIKISDTEMRLPSGAVINSRSDITQVRGKPGLAQSRTKSSQHRIKRDEMKAIDAGKDQGMADEKQRGTPYSHDRRVAVRGEMGLAGISENQRRALQITEKKMKRREAVAKAAQRHAAEQEPVKTIYYKVGNTTIWRERLT